MKNVIEYLKRSSEKNPDKIAVIDEFEQVTYRELYVNVQKVGSALLPKINVGEPVAVYMEKGINALQTFGGIVYAGGCYSILNIELPKSRIQQIISVLNPDFIITTEALFEKASLLFAEKIVLKIEELLMDSNSICINRGIIDTDPLYINFTSGSTGVPKGIVVGHRSVIDFIDCFVEKFTITSEDVIANQAPFDFDVSVKDIYSALKVGATLVIIPKRFFSQPVELVEYLCNYKVTTMIWAVSAICLLNTFHAFDYKIPEHINKVLFSGEVMPRKHLLKLKKYLPKTMFVNLYGPTEITCNCTYHILQDERDYSTGIPIGIPFENKDVFLLDADNKRVVEQERIGEICVRGTALALGYYAEPEQNEKYFVQNPLNKKYPEIIYRTGDLAKYDENGELMFCGRKDFQIKYMGHRIELEEIERTISSINGVERCCCIFDEKRSRLKGYYVGSIKKDSLYTVMKAEFPNYMIPGTMVQVEAMPLTKNGKVDRKLLAKIKGDIKNVKI